MTLVVIKDIRICDAAVDMALGSKVHDRVKAVLLKKLLDKSAVMDIAADKV